MISANSPLKKGFIFLLFVLLYYLLNYLNYTRALKIATIGFFGIVFFDLLRVYYPKAKFILYLFTVVVFINMGFHAMLRDIFSVAQDDLVVIQAMVDTDINESKEFIVQYKLYLLKHTILIISIIFIFFKLSVNQKNIYSEKKAKLLTIIFGLIFFIIHLNPSLRRSDPFIYFPYYYKQYKKEIQENKQLIHKLKNSLKNSKFNISYVGKNKKNTIIWIIGESETKYNWSLYGYKRDTNSYLKKIKDEILLFNKAIAAAPATTAAFKLMLTPATKENRNSWTNYPNIILTAKRAGYKTFWISNHTSDRRGVINLFANSANVTIFTNKGKARGEGSYDEIVIKPLSSALKDNANKKLIIVHLMEAHPAYDYRYPKKFSYYTTIFSDSVIRELKKEGRATWALLFRNLYDNAILYSDYVKYNIIKEVKKSKDANITTVIYHPDHGEDVCHNSNFSGHNFKAKQQWEVPMFIWGKKKKKFINISNKEFDLDSIDTVILKSLDINITKEKK